MSAFAFPIPVQKLVRELSKLPSIGEKSATRLAYHLVANDPDLSDSLADALRAAKQSVGLCEECYFLSEHPRCSICTNPSRDRSLICIVEKPMDLISIERMGEFKGIYHVLHGIWAPLRGLGPETMRLEELVERVKREKIEEAILATSSTVEGDATALYIARILGELGVKNTRLAQGVPKGGELEYLDDVTLSRALAGRSLMG